jgi:hypothetical protein
MVQPYTHTILSISAFKSFHITSFQTDIYPALVSCPSCVHEELGINQKAKIKNDNPTRIKGLT